MNKEQFKGSWLQLKGKIKEKWGKLTDDDLAVVEGREDRLIGKLQERYGIAKAEAERQLREFLVSCRSKAEAARHAREFLSDCEPPKLRHKQGRR